MSGPGKVLQQARKKKRFSIDRVHKTTKIKREYIEGLENDNVSAFPAELYYKNFLKTYALFLSLDPNEMINMYEQSKLDQQEDLFKQSNNNAENKFIEFYKKNKQTLIYAGYAVAAVLIICIIIMLIPTKKAVLPEETSVQTISKKEQESAATNSQQTEQKLYIKALEDTWIKISGDNKKLFESILSKDKTFEATTKKEFNIKIGNIDGIEVYFNDKLVDISKGASNSKVNTITLKRD
ncbi:helix-turn-helix domain-containing protein [Candidatus Ruminimicrobiellum ovillum]|uniref:helix-turn-helix domain-containing protein n=1 Tax=Candidatus Ruminimicrobiellum ovillum TaxID=1947927 RepID=UPI00355A93D4